MVFFYHFGFYLFVMKKSLLTICAISLLAFNGYAQTFCETSAYSPYKDYLLNAEGDWSDYSFCVTIYIHVVRRSDGTGGQSVANVNEALTYLDSAFNPYSIYFKWDHNINYIDNSTYFNSPRKIFDLTFYDHHDGVDIYLFDDTVGGVAGWGYGATEDVGADSKLLVTGVHRNNPLYPLVRSYVLAHEMGHVFNLWHTRHGTVTEDGDGNQCHEWANGLNGSECGDYISDTPADPDMAYNVEYPDCFWPFEVLDDNEEYFDPDELNIMGQTHVACMEYFTFLQSRRMKKALALLPFLQDVSSYIISPSYPCSSIAPLIFYPNATDNELNLDLTNRPANIYTYELYDSYGIMVLSGESPNILKTLDVSGLPEGIYFLHFYENGEIIIKQILVDR